MAWSRNEKGSVCSTRMIFSYRGRHLELSRRKVELRDAATSARPARSRGRNRSRDDSWVFILEKNKRVNIVMIFTIINLHSVLELKTGVKKAFSYGWLMCKAFCSLRANLLSLLKGLVKTVCHFLLDVGLFPMSWVREVDSMALSERRGKEPLVEIRYR